MHTQVFVQLASSSRTSSRAGRRPPRELVVHWIAQWNLAFTVAQNQKRWIPRDIGRIKVDTDEGHVEFRPLHKNDEGIYTCVAINDVGADDTSANVRVLGMSYNERFLIQLRLRTRQRSKQVSK